MIPILGKSTASVEQMRSYLNKKHLNAPDLAPIYIKEGEAEGIRGDVAFAQMLKETGNLYFTKDATATGQPGLARPEWHNPAGLGVDGTYTNKVPNGNKFPSWEIGARAHIQHLRGYATKEPLKQPCVDQRYQLLIDKKMLGTAPNFENLNGKWAWPGTNYHVGIISIWQDILKEPKIDRLPFTIMTVNELLDYCKTFKWTRPITEFCVHHTVTPDHTDFKNKPNSHIYYQEAMYRYHTITRGWRDLAQQISLFPDGKFVTGRDFNMNPASGLGEQNNNVYMVEMIGNFDKGNDKFQGIQADAIFRFIAGFLTLKQLPLTAIRFHRELAGSGKTCPGTSIIKEDFVDAVKTYQIYKI